MLVIMMNVSSTNLHQCLLDSRVSVLLECSPEALPLLVDYGFTPLSNPTLRAALAPTVTLAQALKLRGLPPGQEEKLLASLEEVCACRL